MTVQVPFYRHELTPADAGRIAEVMGTPFLTSGPVGKAVEAQLCAFFGTQHAALVNSWTNGALALLLALDIKPGDEVIVPAMTFIASANIAELIGAKPVFADIDPNTLLLTPDGVARALTPRTRAVIPVHLYGLMCDLRGIRAALGSRSDIAIIEDAAHCFEGARDGYLPGQESDAAVFSFYATKNICCGEGGAIVTSRTDLHEKLLQTRLHGMSASAADRFKGASYRHWDMARLGVKANLPDLLAALLGPQIETVRARLPRREALARRYTEAFSGTGLRLQASAGNSVHARHLFTIHVPPANRDEAIARLNAKGIAVTVNYRSVPTLTYYNERYGYGPADFPESYNWGGGTLSLPFFPGLTEEEQAHVIGTVLQEVVPLARA